ncbi:beta-lactamase/transpeptidase-like protein [Decorospora gaudefroyi]|uniref:Beta-lactamase/transpeptidase-like protein n=1 Tax=Decorospora gaudefroyi TaxID=184978 RepID=A0A6A5KPN2_9PLEO|nr:beta-lactamase/transpeptidase-like protein [Decorospora gaudefroyi]
MANFEEAYEKAIKDKILPGYALIAGDKNGNILYSGAKGVRSLVEDSAGPFQLDTICAIASMTKIMTSVAALQCVEDGLITLDEDVSSHLPSIGKYGIMTGFDDDKNEVITVPNATPITLRMLLSHTNGHESDWFNPMLMKWRASRGETSFCGPTVEEKSTLPLLYEPGTSFRYGAGSDWAGKLIEKVSGKTLDTFMNERIWTPLGIKDMTFYPKRRADMTDRTARFSTLKEDGSGPATDMGGFDVTFGATDCLGGAGAFASASAFVTFLQAVLRRDEQLLNEASWAELFRPQLDERCKRAFNDYIKSSPLHEQYLGMCLPTNIEKQWSFAGMLVEQGQEGRMNEGTICWGGVPSMTWYIDAKAGICGVAFAQILPPMSPSILKLHEGFQRAMFGKAGA